MELADNPGYGGDLGVLSEVTATLDGVTNPPSRSNDEPLNPDQLAMLADSRDLTTLDLVSVTNGILTKVHQPEDCEVRGGNCWVHDPTPDWPLAGRPVVWSARRRMAYRLCEHDLAHPDVDAFAYATRYRTNYAGRRTRESDPEWHECDGCCREEAPRDSPGGR